MMTFLIVIGVVAGVTVGIQMLLYKTSSASR